MTPRGALHFINRELSWLEFNSRVLEEAQDAKNPLLDRIRFYCIFHNNLDEFFMVRVASLLRQIQEGDTKPDHAGLTPHRALELIFARIRELHGICSSLYEGKLLPALAKEKIRILSMDAVSPPQQKFLDDYFESEIYPILTPIAIDPAHPFPRLAGLALHLGVLLEPEKGELKEPRLAVVQVPIRAPGLCRLPEASQMEFCWLSDVILRRVALLFSGFRVLEVSRFRLARDSELELDDEGRYDYVRMLESELKQRLSAKPICLQYEQSMSQAMLTRLQQGQGMENCELLPVKVPLDPRPLLSLVDMPGFDKLRYPPQPPLRPLVFDREQDIFRILRDGDVLIHTPYDSFDPVVELIRSAAEDPDVLAIKQTLYRASGKGSPILEALLQAAENGKQVAVLVELTARFDEERNIVWARDLEQAGAHVLYGLAGLKVHAKIALVVRREATGIRRYVHLGTGNYNEKTARLYTDFGLLTAADDFGSDASGFFNTITGYSELPTFRRLIMAPSGMREKIISLIRREANRARSGQVSGMLAKMNSLVDSTIIQELYAASSAGVPIRLNVRGICCLRPGVSGLSENIRVVSIVDRYLEHSRAFVFRNGGDSEVYLSSADWMPRNLDRRVELMFPVVQPDAREQVIGVLEAQFSDNQKARALTAEGKYERVSAGSADAVRIQELLYRNNVEARERMRAVAPVRFNPIEGKK